MTTPPPNPAPRRGEDRGSSQRKLSGLMHTFRTASPDRYLLLKQFADRMKKFPTHAEQLLWERLRASRLGYRFRFQYIIGDYIADFVCLENDLVVEVDGEYHFKEEQMIDDKLRTESFQRLGFEVIRFTNLEVCSDIETVIQTILAKIKK